MLPPHAWRKPLLGQVTHSRDSATHHAADELKLIRHSMQLWLGAARALCCCCWRGPLLVTARRRAKAAFHTRLHMKHNFFEMYDKTQVSQTALKRRVVHEEDHIVQTGGSSGRLSTTCPRAALAPDEAKATIYL